MANQSTEFLRVIRVWAAVAWADGVIASAESVALRKLIQIADLTDADRQTASSYLDERVDFDAEGLGTLSIDAREGIYKAAVRLANVDLDLATEELTLIERLRQALSIEPHRAQELIKLMEIG